jgi:hypothetical protein
LEVTLVKFISNLFDSYRLDNPTLNLAQASAPAHPIVLPPQNPDQPPVSFNPEARAQTLALKVAPRVVRGRVPRTVTGEIAVDKLPDVPAILVQVVQAKVERNPDKPDNTETLVTCRILLNAYDENPDSSGYQDVLNMAEMLTIALTSFGQQGIDQVYPIVLPIEWKLLEADTYPHYIADMTTYWELPSGRPMPDSDVFSVVPTEHPEFRLDEQDPVIPSEQP